MKRIVLVDVTVVVIAAYEVTTASGLFVTRSVLVVVISAEVVVWLGTGSTSGGRDGAPEKVGSGCGCQESASNLVR